MRPRVADRYVPSIYAELASLSGTSGTVVAAAPSTANLAIYVPVIFPYPCQLYSISFVAANGTGNYDLGFYDGYSKNKIQSSGSTAVTAAGTKTLTFTNDYRVDAGKVYYGALAMSSTSGSHWRFAGSSTTCLIMGGCGQEAALPLNSTMTPVTIAANVVPIFIFGVR